MNGRKVIGGFLECELTCADPADFLRSMERCGITLQDIHAVSELTIRFTVERKYYRTLSRNARRRGEELHICSREGLYWRLTGMWKRPVLLLGMLLLFFLSCWMPSRIFFVRVEGNVQVHTNRILEEAANCGLCFGASRREVRSERMKNALLEQMPQLQWAGVNTYGCVAVITVQERELNAQQEDAASVRSIVAARDGIIRDLTVTRGTGMCAVGQTVKAGEVLISGYTDLGSFIRADKADGEIFAETLRKVTVLLPTERAVRQEKRESTKKYGLIIGKKRINFYNSSGISDVSCVKIYSQQYVTLPGGFVLPVALYVEERISYSTVPGSITDGETIFQPFITNYLQSQMIGGQILRQSAVITDGVGYCRLDGIYCCLEMIGTIRIEESILDYEDY